MSSWPLTLSHHLIWFFRPFTTVLIGSPTFRLVLTLIFDVPENSPNLDLPNKFVEETTLRARKNRSRTRLNK